MFLTVAIVVGILGHLSSGVPLEDPSTDLKQFFDNRIVGGTEADEGSTPWMVALGVGEKVISFICGASIIKDEWIISAAHCITSFIQWNGDLLKTFHGRVGSNTWHKGIIIEFVCYRIHPEYDQWLIKNDVALLRTQRKIQFNNKVAPIRLNFDTVEGGEKSFVTGWGTEMLGGITPDRLRILYVETLTYQQCQDLVRNITETWGGWAPHIDPKTEICTSHPKGVGFGLCHGDSGSGVVAEHTGLLFGIVTWTFPCAIGGPDVHGSIKGFKKFIESTITTGV